VSKPSLVLRLFEPKLCRIEDLMVICVNLPCLDQRGRETRDPADGESRQSAACFFQSTPHVLSSRVEVEDQTAL
jgi:hypothetical protein